MYHWPENYKARGGKKPINIEIDLLLKTRTILLQILYEGSDKLIKKLVSDVTVPETTNETYDTFVKIIENVREVENLAEYSQFYSRPSCK